MRERLLGIVAMAAILVGVAVFLSLWLTNGGGHTMTEWALGEAPQRYVMIVPAQPNDMLRFISYALPRLPEDEAYVSLFDAVVKSIEFQ